MSYRTVEVDGKEYEYVVGESHVKVKGVGVWLREEVGYTADDDKIRVRPSDIVNKIRSTTV